MRKKTMAHVQELNIVSEPHWLDLEKLAVAEVTSEESIFPIESALLPHGVSGWRASKVGEQMVRLVFDRPQRLQCIRLNFEELDTERTQEYVLRWSSDKGQSYQEIVRQQWNFSPEGATSELEDHQVDLMAVTILELSINPDIRDKNATASLKQLQVA